MVDSHQISGVSGNDLRPAPAYTDWSAIAVGACSLVTPLTLIWAEIGVSLVISIKVVSFRANTLNEAGSRRWLRNS